MDAPANSPPDLANNTPNNQTPDKQPVTQTVETQPAKSEESKSESKVETVAGASPELDAAILKQVEYYFSDVNLVRDKFLRNEIEKDEQGFVKLSVLITFNKLKALSVDFRIISEALRKSQFLVVNEEGTAVKTSRPIPPPKFKSKTDIQIDGKTYTPTELKHKSQELFHKYNQDAEVNEEDRKILLGILQFHPKAEEKKGGQAIEKIVKKRHPLYERDCFFLVRADGTEEDFSLKKCTDMIGSDEKKNEKKKNEKPKGKRTQVNRAEEIAKNLHGCILQFQNVKEGLCRDDFKTYFAQFGFVRYVDFSRGETTGKIRFQEASHARDALQTPPPPEQFGESATFSLLEGQEEEEYINTIAESQLSHRGKFESRGRKFNKGHGGRHPRKKSTDNDD